MERLARQIRRWKSRLTRAFRVQPKSLGERGEDAAARFLRKKGHLIVARGARRPWGEIDLVTVDRQTVVFVEVKTRQSHDAGHPAEAITPAKQRKLSRLALGYLRRNGLLDCPARFDVLAVTWPTSARKPKIEHYINAFDAVGEGQMFS